MIDQLHWAEKPIAALTRLTHVAHISGDTPPIEDFYHFRPQQPGETPPVEAGAAMLELIRCGQFPSFALAFYEQLNAAGKDQPVPARLALVADDAILLAPISTLGGWRGFLIAEDTAAGQVRAFQPSWGQDSVLLTVPPPDDESKAAVWAAAAASLAIPPSPHRPDSP